MLVQSKKNSSLFGLFFLATRANTCGDLDKGSQGQHSAHQIMRCYFCCPGTGSTNPLALKRMICCTECWPWDPLSRSPQYTNVGDDFFLRKLANTAGNALCCDCTRWRVSRIQPLHISLRARPTTTCRAVKLGLAHPAVVGLRGGPPFRSSWTTPRTGVVALRPPRDPACGSQKSLCREPQANICLSSEPQIH